MYLKQFSFLHILIIFFYQFSLLCRWYYLHSSIKLPKRDEQDKFEEGKSPFTVISIFQNRDAAFLSISPLPQYSFEIYSTKQSMYSEYVVVDLNILQNGDTQAHVFYLDTCWTKYSEFSSASVNIPRLQKCACSMCC